MGSLTSYTRCNKSYYNFGSLVKMIWDSNNHFAKDLVALSKIWKMPQSWNLNMSVKPYLTPPNAQTSCPLLHLLNLTLPPGLLA